MQILGIIFLGAVTIQVIILIYSSISHLKWERDMHLLSLRQFENQLQSKLDTKNHQDHFLKGWEGFRNFVVKDKIYEGGGICSFILTPEDKRPLPTFQPGQYLTFQLSIPGREKPVVRCYSLSDCPCPDTYRVSIKKILPPPSANSMPPGLVSSYFHNSVNRGDLLKIKAPNGEFYLDSKNEHPLVLIAGGVGVTPLLSMVNTLAAKKSKQHIWLFYGVRNEDEHIMKDILAELASALPKFNLRICYSDNISHGNTINEMTQIVKTDSGIVVSKVYRADLVNVDTKSRFPITKECILIGRSSKADMTVDSPHLSATHAQIKFDESTWTIEDLNSKNGTILNGKLLKSESAVLSHNDLIYFGSKEIPFLFSTSNDSEENIIDNRYIMATKNPNEFILKKQRITINLLKSQLPSNNFDFYICGPAEMMKQLTDDLMGWGVPEQKIHFESFGPASVAKVRTNKQLTESRAESNIEVSFSKTNKKCNWDPQFNNILEFAESLGIAMDSGCRTGSCGTCMTRINAGRVHYLDTPGADIETGMCLTCIATPQTDISLDA